MNYRRHLRMEIVLFFVMNKDYMVCAMHREQCSVALID